MREMVLNHASVWAPGSARSSITDWLTDVASGMGQLIRGQVVQRSLRMEQGFHQTPCLPDCSLYEAILGLPTPRYREERVFLMGLAAKSPLLSQVGAKVKGRFRACEARKLPTGDGEPLVLCAIADWIAIGFPSAPEWDLERITIHFDELLPDATIGEASEEIDQLTRSAHAGPICERHRDLLRAGSDPGTLWKSRRTIFPNLVFGPAVESHLKAHASLLRTIAGKLVALDHSARDWPNKGGPVPPWTNVSPESDSVMQNPKLRKARIFPSHHGTQEIFEWHARCGNGFRIHLRFDPSSWEVEIGYIGPKLPAPVRRR